MSKVIRKHLMCVKVSLDSPLCVASGREQWTDADVIRDFDGKPFVPGTTIAGAMREYVGCAKDSEGTFGYSKKSDGKMSSVFISDLTFDEALEMVIRDNVALKSGVLPKDDAQELVSIRNNKLAIDGAKFDMEAIERGAKGHFFIEIIIREKDNWEKIEEEIRHALYGIYSGDIRFGLKKNRGFGAMKVLSVASKVYDKKNISTWVSAYEDALTGKDFLVEDFTDTKMHLFSCVEQVGKKAVSYTTIQVPLRMPGGLSIRKYSAKKGEPDFVQITSNEEAVVPGTSMAGAIRSQIMEILYLLGVKNVKGIIQEMFGYVEGNKAKPSTVVISESVVLGAKPLILVRNKISRFEGATKDGALYKEKSYFDGRINLEIKVKDQQDTPWMVGLLLLAIKDLQNGFLAVGGQTSVGRGIFEADGEVTIDAKQHWDEQVYYDAVRALRRENG